LPGGALRISSRPPTQSIQLEHCTMDWQMKRGYQIFSNLIIRHFLCLVTAAVTGYLDKKERTQIYDCKSFILSPLEHATLAASENCRPPRRPVAFKYALLFQLTFVNPCVLPILDARGHQGWCAAPPGFRLGSNNPSPICQKWAKTIGAFSICMYVHTYGTCTELHRLGAI